MAQIIKHQDLLSVRAKASLFGTSIPVSLYLLDSLLIDCGPRSLQKEFAPFFQENKISSAVLTHIHEDHSGLASFLQERSRALVYCTDYAQKWAGQKGKIPWYRRLIWGIRPAFSATLVPERLETENFALQTIELSGHSESDLVLYSPERGWVFTGDLYVRSRPTVAFAEEDMPKTISSLQSLLNLDFETVFCAHAGILTKGRQKLKEKLNYLLEMEERVNELKEKGLGLGEIRKRLFPRKLLIEYISLGEWSAMNIIKSL